MKPSNNKKQKDRVAAVIMLCFCLIALTSIFTIKSSIDKISNKAANVPVSEKSSVSDSSAKSNDNAASKNTEKEVSLPADTEKTSNTAPIVDSKNRVKSGEFVNPLKDADGKTYKKYSMNMVIYNSTLDQYMTHPGLDLEAPSGSMVRACAAGNVSDVYNDDAYGKTIEVTTNSGYVIRYCNLAKSSDYVEKGDVVKQNQVIGKIGRSAMYESLDPAHLHLEVIQDGKTLNPARFIRL